MIKSSTKMSVLISMLLSIAFMVIIIVCAIFVPSMMNTFRYVAILFCNGNISGDINPAYVFAGTYFILAVAALCDVLLFILLLRIRENKIFTKESVSLISAVSWCCILLGLFFCAIGYFFVITVFIGFAVAFVGLCIRVVKNAIEEATIIKSENELTV